MEPLKGFTGLLYFALIPSLLITFKIVITKILKSKINDKLSTYDTSYSNFLSQEMLFLPLICANPVNPGFTKCLFLSKFE